MVQGQTQKSNTVVYPSRHRAVQLVIGVLILLGAMATVHYGPMPAQGASRDDLQIQIHELTVQIEQLRQEQSMPALVLNAYRNSIGYIYGIYHVGFSNQRPLIPARVSGTGFLVGDSLVATNRHIAEPWYGDSESEKLVLRGAIPIVETLVIFFPGLSTPVRLSHPSVSKSSDLAVHATNKDQEHPGRRLKKKMSGVRTFNKLLLRLIDLTICTLHGELVRLPELILKVHPFRR